MQVTVLGCSGTFPGPEGPCSGYLVEHEGYRLVLDLGAGALGELQRHCGLLDVDAVYLSHLHTDHCIDLVAWAYALRYHPGGLPPVMTVHGPPGSRARLVAAFDESPEPDLIGVYDFQEHGPTTLQLGPLAVTTTRVRHPIECHGIRVEAGGRVFAYSGDTAVCDGVLEVARDADLFLCEASWPADPPPPPGIHLTGVEAGQAATDAGAKRLVLTHVMPFHPVTTMLAEARTTWSGPLEAAARGAVYDV